MPKYKNLYADIRKADSKKGPSCILKYVNIYGYQNILERNLI